jgi:hypothetical protein
VGTGEVHGVLALGERQAPGDLSDRIVRYCEEHHVGAVDDLSRVEDGDVRKKPRGAFE